MRAAVLALAFLAAPAMAQQGALDPKRSADQVQRYLHVLKTCETQGLADMIDPEVSSIGLRGAFAQSKPVYVQAVQGQCTLGVRLDAEANVLRHAEFGDIALTALELTGTSTVGGQTVPANLRLTLAMRRGADGVWRILHSQTGTAF